MNYEQLNPWNLYDELHYQIDAIGYQPDMLDVDSALIDGLFGVFYHHKAVPSVQLAACLEYIVRELAIDPETMADLCAEYIRKAAP